MAFGPIIYYSRSFKTFRGWPKRIPNNPNNVDSSTLKKPCVTEFNFEENWPNKNKWEFSKVYDIINKSYIENIKYLPHPDIHLDPWLSPANERMRWLYLISRRYGADAAENFIKSSPIITRFRSETLKEKVRSVPVDISTNLRYALLCDNVDQAYKLAKKSIKDGKILEEDLTNSLVESLSAQENIELLRSNPEFKQWPTFLKVLTLFPNNNGDIPLEFYESFFFGLLKKIFLEGKRQNYSTLCPLVLGILDLPINHSSYFYSYVFQYRDFIFQSAQFNVVLKKITEDLKNYSFVLSKEMFPNVIKFLSTKDVFKFFKIYLQIHGNDDIGISIYSQVFKALSHSDLEAIQFFCYSLNQMKNQDMLDYSNESVALYFWNGFHLLKRYGLNKTILSCAKQMRNIQAFTIMENDLSIKFLSDIFTYLAEKGTPEQVINFLTITNVVPVESIVYYEKVIEYFVNLDNIDLLITAMDILIKYKIHLNIQNMAIYLLHKLSECLKKNPISMRLTKKILYMNEALQRMGNISNQDSNFIEIVCCISRNEFEQVRNLLANNIQLMDDSCWRALFLNTLKNDRSFISKMLHVVGRYLPIAYIEEIFEYNCLLLQISFEEQTEIWKNFISKYDEAIKF